MSYSFTRLRRTRINPAVRNLICETSLSLQHIVYPLFIRHGHNQIIPIHSMPTVNQITLDHLVTEIQNLHALGINAVMLFGIPHEKDATGSCSHDDSGLIQEAIRLIKAEAPEFIVMGDICLCEYTSHGHCGVISDDRAVTVDNDKTLPILAAQAVSMAKAGVDIVAPSGMMDGAVLAIREALDEAGFIHLPIMGYSVKYASGLYGPFRDAAEGAPQFGNRRSYQMDIRNSSEAYREAEADIAEGVDMLMVKPASYYLDVISNLKQRYPEMPLAAYQVSGEFSMIKAAAEKGWLDESAMIIESLTAIKRAGADVIITYFAKDLARLLSQ